MLCQTIHAPQNFLDILLLMQQIMRLNGEKITILFNSKHGVLDLPV